MRRVVPAATEARLASGLVAVAHALVVRKCVAWLRREEMVRWVSSGAFVRGAFGGVEAVVRAGVGLMLVRSAEEVGEKLVRVVRDRSTPPESVEASRETRVVLDAALRWVGACQLMLAALLATVLDAGNAKRFLTVLLVGDVAQYAWFAHRTLHNVAKPWRSPAVVLGFALASATVYAKALFLLARPAIVQR